MSIHSGFICFLLDILLTDPISAVKIQNNVNWLQSKNMCTFHLHCVTFGPVNASFNWSGYQVGNGPHLSFNLTAEARATLNCTASNPISVKYTTTTVMCKKENGSNVTSGGFAAQGPDSQNIFRKTFFSIFGKNKEVSKFSNQKLLLI